MTTEERAEDFANSFDYTDNSNYESGYLKSSEKIAYEAHLAGLQAGRPEWHRVDKEALPDDFRYVWTNIGAGYYDGEHWRDEYGILRGVTAWCEPKFEED